MFVDASAIVAVVTGEADSILLGTKLREAPERYTSPIAIYESVLGIARILRAPPEEVSVLVDDFIADADIRLFVIDHSISRTAIEAFARYGKGRHRAGLNMGDCFAYACAKSLGVPLLCKGDDFPHTDIPLA